MPCATCHVFRYQIVEYIRTVFAISVPIVWDAGTSEQSRAIVFASFLLPWPIFALLRPYTYRGDMYFSHASYALTVARVHCTRLHCRKIGNESVVSPFRMEDILVGLFPYSRGLRFRFGVGLK